MILILIPLAGILVGLGMWGAMRGLGAFNVLGGEAGPSSRSSRHDRAPTSLRERIEDAPTGCLLSVVVACGVWILGWLVVLVIGLTLLS